MIVLDHLPDDEEVSDLALAHLEDFPAEEAHASCEIVYQAPSWLEVHERDQMDAYIRDGAACILVVYMVEGCGDDSEDDF